MVKCQNCGCENTNDSSFCVKCGSKINKTSTENSKFCPKCGAENSPENTFCNSCGAGLNQQNNICPYCHVEVEPGVLKCKNCGEWINRPPNYKSTNIDSLKILENPKIMIIAAYVFSLIGIVLALVSYNTPYINLSGILAIDLIWIIITFLLVGFIYKNFANMDVDILGIRNVKIHLLIIIVINVFLILFWIKMYTWNPLADYYDDYYYLTYLL